MRIIFLFLALFLIIFEAVPEGFYDRGWKFLSGLSQSIYLATVTIGLYFLLAGTAGSNLPVEFLPFTFNDGVIKLLISYVFVRFGIFDLAYNLARGNEPFFIGTTKLTDKLIRFVMNKLRIPSIIINSIRLIILVIGITWLMGWENGIKF